MVVRNSENLMQNGHSRSFNVMYLVFGVSGNWKGDDGLNIPGGAKKRPEHSQVLHSSAIDRFVKFLHCYIQR